MATITDAELLSLPPQRPYALMRFAQRWDPSHAVLWHDRDHDRCLGRALTRAFIHLTRRQECLRHTPALAT